MAKFKPWEYVTERTVKVSGGATTNPKKITGSRFGAVVGVNKWKSPFGAWCEVTRVAEEPFEGNEYTAFGEAVEPQLIDVCRTEVSPHIVTPADMGLYKERCGYDFFDHTIFGGMWDALALDKPLDKGGKPIAVIEAKTSSRPQDWENGVPASYAVQGLLYAVLLGVDRVFFPVAFADKMNGDYANPENFVCTDENTVVYELKVSESNIREMMDEAQEWWMSHVEGNCSPEFDAKRDKVFLDIMRCNQVTDEGLEAYAKQAAVLEAKIEAIREDNGLDALEKELKKLKERIKADMIPKFGTTDETVTAYGWEVKRTFSSGIDKEALATDNLLDKYTVPTAKYTLKKVR